MGALALELPFTTTLMLRSIAGIAARHGENLEEPGSRLACLEVFALGPQGNEALPVRPATTRLAPSWQRRSAKPRRRSLERRIACGSAPLIVDLITLHRVAVRGGGIGKGGGGAIPVVGAIGGAAVNTRLHAALSANGAGSLRRPSPGTALRAAAGSKQISSYDDIAKSASLDSGL